MKRFAISMAAVMVVAAGAAAAPKNNGGGKSINLGGRSIKINLPGKVNQGGNGNHGQKFQPAVIKDTKINIHLGGQQHHHQNFFGVKFSHGHCFKGFTHSHWACKTWFPQYGCYAHWCPVTSCYYYWCQPDGCWYPVSYCPYGKYCW